MLQYTKDSFVAEKAFQTYVDGTVVKHVYFTYNLFKTIMFGMKLHKNLNGNKFDILEFFNKIELKLIKILKLSVVDKKANKIGRNILWQAIREFQEFEGSAKQTYYTQLNYDYGHYNLVQITNQLFSYLVDINIRTFVKQEFGQSKSYSISNMITHEFTKSEKDKLTKLFMDDARDYAFGYFE